MSMLEKNGDVQGLSSARKHDFVSKSVEAIGQEESKYLQSLSFGMIDFAAPSFRCFASACFFVSYCVTAILGLCCIKSMLCGSKAKFGAKSAFSRATRSDLTLMAINLRKRVKETDDMDAGNYSLVVLYDTEGSASPSVIRQSLNEGPPFTRKGGKPLPGFFKTINLKVAMITNWAFPQFQADMALLSADGENNVPLELHLPIPYHPKQVAFPIGVIFRPRAGKLGILYGGAPRNMSGDGLITAGAPIGERISSEMFPD
mmetsp:Transcript_34998/g.74651  ORF Transcript_34998/g.74651 Transcript_34998/m.74651 type:complete len:259 (+) Transcript_34998:562-1338(+)